MSALLNTLCHGLGNSLSRRSGTILSQQARARYRANATAAGPQTATQLYIDGSFCDGSAGKKTSVVNPATGKALWEVASASVEDVDRAVLAARRTFDSDVWGVFGPSGKERAEILRKMGAALRAEQDQWAMLETLDNGKPIAEAKADIESCASMFDYFGGLAENLDKEQERAVDTLDDDLSGVVRREPIGVVGMVTPWNFPLLQSVAKVAPAIAAGCTMVIKPSSVAPMTTLRLGQLADKAGLPKGVMNIVNGTGRECGGALISHPQLDKVSFTGSAAAGKHIMQTCAQFLRPVSLELGGKGAIMVFEDADLKSAVDWIMVGIFMCQGQVCSATSRLLVHDSIADDLIARLVEETKKIKMGDPVDDKNNMGPMVSEAQANQVKEYLAHAIKDERCKVIIGAEQENAKKLDGYYVEPIIVDNVPIDSSLWQEEIFGPFLSVRRFSTEEEAIKLTNDSPYGLGNSALTTDPERAKRLSRALRSGSVWINCNNAVPVSMPFGGFKASGFGREMGQEGLDDYLHSKSVVQAKKHGFSWNWYC